MNVPNEIGRYPPGRFRRLPLFLQFGPPLLLLPDGVQLSGGDLAFDAQAIAAGQFRQIPLKLRRSLHPITAPGLFRSLTIRVADRVGVWWNIWIPVPGWLRGRARQIRAQ